MTDIQIYIWDVERGDAMLVKAPAGNIVVDLGQHRNGFSPTRQMQNHGVDEVDYIIISHPDADHIRDIVVFYDNYFPQVISRAEDALPYVKHKKRHIYPDDEVYQDIAGKYIDLLENRYPRNIDPPISVGNLVVSEKSLSAAELGMTPAHQLNRNTNPDLNNLSLLNMVEYEGLQMATMGDIKDDAIEQLLESSSVRRKLRGTDVLVAPHHGRRSSYTSDLFDVISPDLVAISDAAGTEHSASSQYSNQAAGKVVERRNGDPTQRSVISTRNDGVLYFGIDSDGSYKAKID